jgi:hypothetical protein
VSGLIKSSLLKILGSSINVIVGNAKILRVWSSCQTY